MATKKTKADSPKNTERVTIKIDRVPGQKEQDDVVIAVNGERWQIQRGVEVSVPKRVADAFELWQREISEAELEDFSFMN